jgi:hypothetical protein
VLSHEKGRIRTQSIENTCKLHCDVTSTKHSHLLGLGFKAEEAIGVNNMLLCIL